MEILELKNTANEKKKKDPSMNGLNGRTEATEEGINRVNVSILVEQQNLPRTTDNTLKKVSGVSETCGAITKDLTLTSLAF